MRVTAYCVHCNHEKLVEEQYGSYDLVFDYLQSGKQIIRVFCPHCGINYTPESIGCIPKFAVHVEQP